MDRVTQRAGLPAIQQSVSGLLQALITAALILPTFALVYLRLELLDRPARIDSAWNVAWTVALGLYFVAVVFVMGRGLRRRIGAASVALLVLACEVAAAGLFRWLIRSEGGAYIGWVLLVTASMLAVIAWGVARRRHILWVFGLVPAFMVAITAVIAGTNRWFGSRPTILACGIGVVITMPLAVLIQAYAYRSLVSSS